MILLTAIALVLTAASWAAEHISHVSNLERVTDSVTIKIYFPINKTEYRPDYMGNAKRIRSTIDSIRALSADTALQPIGTLCVQGWASPEGPRKFNYWLAQHRAERLGEMLGGLLPTDVEIIVCEAGILPPPGPDAAPMSYPALRHATATIIFTRDYNPEVDTQYIQDSHDLGLVSLDCPESPDCPEGPDCLDCPASPEIEPEWYRYPWAALRTNLLTPAMSIGAELPIGNRWSAAADWNYPWVWRNGKHRNCFELSFLTLEGRYWLGRNHEPGDENRVNRLLGHSIGAYGAWGYYDFEHDWHGHQGHFWSAGVDYLWARSAFGGALHFEFEIALGWIYSNSQPYNVYEKGGWLYREKGHKKNLNYFGPTKAAINLVVPLYRKVRKQ